MSDPDEPSSAEVEKSLREEVASIKRSMDYLPLFSEYREKVKAENELVNQRMTWFIVLQSFMFISLAILSNSQQLTEKYLWIVLAYVTVGCASAVANILSVKAAFTALEATHDQWGTLSKKLDPGFHFPALKGGGPEHVGDDRGKALTTVLGPAVIVAWLAILIVVAMTFMEGGGAQLNNAAQNQTVSDLDAQRDPTGTGDKME